MGEGFSELFNLRETQRMKMRAETEHDTFFIQLIFTKLINVCFAQIFRHRFTFSHLFCERKSHVFALSVLPIKGI